MFCQFKDNCVLMNIFIIITTCSDSKIIITYKERNLNLSLVSKCSAS